MIRGKTPLMASIGAPRQTPGHKRVVDILLEKGAFLNTENDNQMTALSLAVKHGYTDTWWDHAWVVHLVLGAWCLPFWLEHRQTALAGKCSKSEYTFFYKNVVYKNIKLKRVYHIQCVDDMISL